MREHDKEILEELRAIKWILVDLHDHVTALCEDEEREENRNV